MVSSGSSDLPLQLNPWEDQALNVSYPPSAALPWVQMQTEPEIVNAACNQYEFPQQPPAHGDGGNNNTNAPAWIQLPDPIIYPGVYSASGIDVMGILVRKRPLAYPCPTLLFPAMVGIVMLIVPCPVASCSATEPEDRPWPSRLLRLPHLVRYQLTECPHRVCLPWLLSTHRLLCCRDYGSKLSISANVSPYAAAGQGE